MLENDELMSALDRLDDVINGEQALMVKALGILLLGKTYDKATLKNSKDPTDIILGRGVRMESPEF